VSAEAVQFVRTFQSGVASRESPIAISVAFCPNGEWRLI